MIAKLLTLREKCPNTEFFLVCILPHSDYLFVFSPNVGKYGPEKLRIWTLFTQCNFMYSLTSLTIIISKMFSNNSSISNDSINFTKINYLYLEVVVAHNQSQYILRPGRNQLIFLNHLIERGQYIAVLMPPPPTQCYV